jgi:beta-glucosidase
MAWRESLGIILAAVAALVFPGCRDGGDSSLEIRFPKDFSLGAATAAEQIEDGDDQSDWYLWTGPEPEGLAHGTFVGQAAQGYSRALDDVQLLTRLHLDAYRFSISWSRVEPRRDAVDEAALQHYDELIDVLVAAGIKPMITVHHFSSPVWVDDPRRGVECPDGPGDTDLCGWNDPAGAEQIIAELAEHARTLAARYGDRVDEWCTLNEPLNYLLAGYGVGIFPPGRSLLLGDFNGFIDAVRNYTRAHVAVYDAIHEADTVDADGDGVAALVGLTLSVSEWVPARDNQVSRDRQDEAARDKIVYVRHHALVESLLSGTFDADLDGQPDEQHPDWAGKLDFLGVQYYARMGVTSSPALMPVLELTPCAGGIDMGSCVPPLDETKWVPSMDYEYYEPGIYNVLSDFAARWPDLPLIVTESGLATDVGRRRAEHIVRSLEQIWYSREEGADVRGYYHWSLIDNFEWMEGYGPHFGLYSVDRSTFERTPTEGATLLGEIAAGRRLTEAMRRDYGGLGPMTPEQ